MAFSKLLSLHYLAGSVITDNERKARWKRNEDAAQAKFDKAYREATPQERAQYHADVEAEKVAETKAGVELTLMLLITGFFWAVTGGFWMGFSCYLIFLFAWSVLPGIAEWACGGITGEVKYRIYKRKENKAAAERLVVIKAALKERRAKA